MARKTFKLEEDTATRSDKNLPQIHGRGSTSPRPVAWEMVEDCLDTAVVHRTRPGIVDDRSLFDDDQHPHFEIACAKTIGPWSRNHSPEFQLLCYDYRSYIIRGPETQSANDSFITSFERFSNRSRPDRVFYYLANLRYRNIKLRGKTRRISRADEISQALKHCHQYLSRNRYPRYLASMEYIYGDLVLEKCCFMRTGSVSAYSVALCMQNIEEAQKHFEKFLALMDVARQELFSLGDTLHLWDMKRSLVAQQERAHSALRLTPFLLMSKGSVDAWEWVQKVKARGMADMLEPSRGKLIPESWESDLQRDDLDGYALLKQEQELIYSFQQRNAREGRFSITPWSYEEEYQKLLHQMRKTPSLSRFMSVRGDTPVSHSELDGLLVSSSRDSGREVVYAEWSIFGGKVYVFIARRHQPIKTISLCQEGWGFDKWISDNLDSSTLSSVEGGSHALRKIKFLVAPLGRLAYPDEIIILCPTGPLHRIPLHALEIDGVALMQRNPVVYTHSASILRRCVLQEEYPDQNESVGAMNVHVVADLFGDRGTAASSATDIAASFRAQKALIGNHPGVCSSVVKGVMEKADILYYHGHASFDSSRVDNLGLYLGSGITMGIKDILGLSLRRGAHVTLIACGSYLQNWTASDEGLGIVPAFLYAGASSAVATFWPAQSKMGDVFGKHFYASLATAMDNEACVSQKWNMALAFQQAVLKVREERPAPYNWAPFALTGYWMFRGDGRAR